MKSIQWPTAAVCIVFVLVVGGLLFAGKTVPAGWVGMAGTIVASFMQAIMGGGSGGGTLPTPPSSTSSVAAKPPTLMRAILVGAVLTCCGCQNGAPTPQTVQDVTIGQNAAACVLGTYSADISAGRGEVDAIADCVLKCGVTAAQATGLLDMHRKAEVAEGFVPRPMGDAGK